MTQPRYDLSVDIDRSIDAVWSFVTDLRRTPEWRTTITTIEPPERVEVGERFSGTTRLLRRDWTWILEVTDVDAPRRFGYTVVEGVARPTVEYLLEPLGDGCRFTMSGWIDEMGIVARVLQPFALRALRRETKVHLEQLRAMLESGE